MGVMRVSVASLVAAGLVVAGVVLLVVFWLVVWPPGALLAVAVACVAAGLLIDWEALCGESSRTPPRR